MKKNVFFFAMACLVAFSIADATTAHVTAQQGAGVSNLFGDPLYGTPVDLGYYDGTFNLLFSSVTNAGVPLPGLFGGSVSFDSNLHLMFQPALRIFSDDGGSVIAYSTAWEFSSGDGSGLDINSDSFDLIDVLSGGELTETGEVLASVGSTFNLNGANNPTFGTPSLAIGVIPESSTYTLIIGVLTFGYLSMARRYNRLD